jgi:hypothetical protein
MIKKFRLLHFEWNGMESDLKKWKRQGVRKLCALDNSAMTG